MKTENFLSKNISALAVSSPAAARAIEAARTPEGLRLQSARNGSTIAAELFDTRWYTLHSSMNPEKEAERAADRHKNEGYLICFGLGVGYYLKEALKIVAPRHGGILLIDNNPGRLRFLLSSFDYTGIFTYTGFRMLVSPSPAEIERTVTDNYLPGFYGNLGVIPLQSIASRQKEQLQTVTEAVQKALEQIKNDFSVQVHFGKLWFDNITSNLPFITGERSPALQALQKRISGSKVFITGAGPGLDSFLVSLSERPADSFLLATDTSLPVLLETGIIPDAAINVDCQFYSLLHALNPGAAAVPWIVPASAAPSLTRLLRYPHFYAGGHPLEKWLSPKLGLPVLDTSGGNVLHTAISLARISGAADITVYGADFCNPGGIPYATGSYIYRWFNDRSRKTAPLYSNLLKFTFDSRDTLSTETIQNSAYNNTYPAPRLSRYRESLEMVLNSTETKLTLTGIDSISDFPALSPGQNRKASRKKICPSSLTEIIDEISLALSETNPQSPSLLYPLTAYLRGNTKIPEKSGADEALSFTRKYAEQRLRYLSETE